MARNKNNELLKRIMEEYQINTLADLNAAVKDLMGSAIETMIDVELDSHLGYDKHQNTNNSTTNRRNGKSSKKVRTTSGEIELSIPRDREGSFEPALVPKRTKNIAELENKILSLYGRGMSQRDIAKTIEEIYGFNASKDMINNVIDTITPLVNEWRNKELKQCYPFVFVDCMYVNCKIDGTNSKKALYVMLGYDIEGHKELLGIWLSQTESKTEWMNIFDSIKQRGVEEILFISMDGVSGLEAGAKMMFPNAVVQRCIVHLVRNSVKFIPSKDMKEFCNDLKKLYANTNAESAKIELEALNNKWTKYPGALRVWNNNFEHVEQLYSYPSDIRRIMYTTNPIEAINSSLRKVTKQGSFLGEKSVFKAIYLRIIQLEEK